MVTFVQIFLAMFFILGISLGPLLIGVAIVALSEGRGRRLAAWSIGLGLKSVYRPAITFNAADELTLKRRSYDEAHDAEYISFGNFLNGVKRYLHDPQDRIHSFYGVPFGFVDEIFGVVVDPRDIALGRALRLEQENGQYEHRVERNNRMFEAVKAVFELPEGHVGVRLPDVSRMVGGSFNSQVVDYIHDLYETSQAPRNSTTALRQMLIPLGAFVGVVLLGMLVAGQAGGGGGGGSPAPSGNASNIGIGTSILFLLLSVPRPTVPRPPRPTLPSLGIEWRDVAFGVVAVGLTLFLGFGLYVAFPIQYPMLGIPLPLGIWAMVFLGLGMGVPPFVAFWFGRSLGPLGIGLGKLYIILGLLGFSKPVIEFDSGEYAVTEYDDHEWAIEPKWYRFAMTRLGIAFPNKEDVWPDGTTLSHAKVAEMGGASGSAGLPAPTDHTVTELIQVDEIYGFVPDDPDEDDVFVRTDRTTGWLLEAGQDPRLLNVALQAAKRKFGGGQQPVSDTWLMRYTFGAMAMAAVFDWMVFF